VARVARDVEEDELEVRGRAVPRRHDKRARLGPTASRAPPRRIALPTPPKNPRLNDPMKPELFPLKVS
jgi:hypothetical protein